MEEAVQPGIELGLGETAMAGTSTTRYSAG